MNFCNTRHPSFVQKRLKQAFNSSFEISSIGFENVAPPGLESHSLH